MEITPGGGRKEELSSTKAPLLTLGESRVSRRKRRASLETKVADVLYAATRAKFLTIGHNFARAQAKAIDDLKFFIQDTAHAPSARGAVIVHATAA